MATISRQALQFASSFEAEIFVHLLLRNWHHPSAEDLEFRNILLEETANALQLSVEGQTLIENISPEDFNFIAAVWFVEWSASQNDNTDIGEHRRNWVAQIKRSLPSCFCDKEDLTP